MPMYEYGCLECERRFDRLRRMNQDDSDVTCPTCASGRVARRLSTFAAVSRGLNGVSHEPAPVATSSGGGCGGCAGGCACSSRN